MYENILEVLSKNEYIWSENAPFGRAAEKFAGVITEMRKSLQVQSLGSAATTYDKGLAKQSMIEQNRIMAALLVLVGHEKGDRKLVKSVEDLQESFTKIRHIEQLERVQNLLAIVKEYSAVLLEAGMPEDQISLLENAVKHFEERIHAPRQVVIFRKVKTLGLPALIRKADHILKQELDSFILFFKGANPEFASAYTQCRIYITRARRAEKPVDEDQNDTGPPGII